MQVGFNSPSITLCFKGSRTAGELNPTCIGPLEIIPKGNVRWVARTSTLNLGRFRTTEGAEAEFLLFISGMDDKKFELLEPRWWGMGPIH